MKDLKENKNEALKDDELNKVHGGDEIIIDGGGNNDDEDSPKVAE